MGRPKRSLKEGDKCRRDRKKRKDGGCEEMMGSMERVQEIVQKKELDRAKEFLRQQGQHAHA
ncbi:hypothetical protein PROFUN_02118 [Planoprotostelium fungivorum]|uniref:Uncharacterized protein n=1 Tax=Planoprotostelium fungivorum TaxID=1890364 RepID=A0A2P6NZ63_9EUKA|nr:hypothetical protein PROFUN_02118 [Planoprotostelium fungivorum]